jgi:hypothetical protein
VNYDYFIEKKFITNDNLDKIIQHIDINTVYTKYKSYMVFRYKYVIACINIILKLKRPTDTICNFMKEFKIYDDFDFIIANYWNTQDPTYKKIFDDRTSSWIRNSLIYKSPKK